MRRVRFLLGLAAVIVIAVGSVLGAAALRSDDRADFDRQQRQAAERAARQTESLATLALGQLNAAAAFYRLQGEIGRHEFAVISRALLGEGSLGTTAFVAARPECCRAVHVATAGGRSPGQGLDLDSASPAHGEALRSARDSGRPTITPLGPTLIADGPGLVGYVPVYRDGAPTRTVAQRRAALLGFAAGGARVTDVAAASITALPDQAEVQMLEGGKVVVGPRQRLSDAAAAPIRIADRTWLLVVRNPNRPGIGLSLLIAALGISISALLGALILIWTRKERMQELQRQASHDSLSGLKNRRRFEEDLRTELARSRREGSEGALLVLDLDNFKQVNDTLGHPIGDRVIEEMASVLNRRTRETDVLARLGGDEFAIALPHSDRAEARAVADAILTAIREHVPRENGVPPITASIGVAMFGADPATGFERLQREADAAMYEAKAAGRDAVRMAGAGERATEQARP